MPELAYQTPTTPAKESWWRLPLALLAGAIALMISGFFAFEPWPALYELATFTPRGPIRPMGMTFFFFLGIMSVLITGPLTLASVSLSDRLPVALVCALTGLCILITALNIVASFAIIAVRGIPLGD